MKNYIIVLLMTLFVSSCRSVERQLICNEIAKYQVNKAESCIVSIKHNTCYCGDFDVNTWEVLTDLRREPLDYCEGIQGVKVDFGIGEIRPKFKALQRLRESSCQKK